MSYIKQTLGRDERVVRPVLLHWFAYAPPALIFAGGVWIAAATAMVWPALIAGAVAAYQLLAIRCTEMAVTNQKVIMKTGIVRRSTEQMSHRKIEEVRLKQSVAGRIFGYYDIEVMGSGGSSIVLDGVADGIAAQQEINSQIG